MFEMHLRFFQFFLSICVPPLGLVCTRLVYITLPPLGGDFGSSFTAQDNKKKKNLDHFYFGEMSRLCVSSSEQGMFPEEEGVFFCCFFVGSDKRECV